MSVVTYGYIELQLVETENYSRDTVTSDDGIDLLYVRHSLTVRAVYNPQATSYRTGTTTPAPGLRPATTDVAIRQYLLTPRLSLTYGDGLGNTILQSPAVGNFLDAKGGPFRMALS